MPIRNPKATPERIKDLNALIMGGTPMKNFSLAHTHEKEGVIILYNDDGETYYFAMPLADLKELRRTMDEAIKFLEGKN